MSKDRWNPLREQLDTLAGKAEHEIDRDRRASRLGAILRAHVWKPAALMLLLLALQLVGRASQSELLRFGLPVLAILAIGAFLVPVLANLFAYARARVGRQKAIGEWDRQLGLRDRLTAADEFLGREVRTPFMEAAVADADAHIKLAREAELRFAPHPTEARALVLPSLTAASLLLIGLWLGGWTAEVVSAPDEVTVDLPLGAEAQEVVPDGELPVREPEVAPEGQEGQARPPEEESTSEAHAADSSQEEEQKETKGATGSGRSSEAQSSTGAGSAQGTPSKQGQISKAGDKKTASKKKKNKPKPPPKNDDKAKKNDEQESGSTAGRGSSRGSNKNPAASDWASKDHVNTPDDSDLEEENEVEDEEEEQEARGGMQPSLRDRKPPVSRDLSIGFGNQPSPDAKGRGGPSQPKKSRGTASLVLGVPIPDRVKGQPNPGKTKITQERVQPRAEPASDIAAESRRTRATPTSALRRQELEPWMRTLVRDWFLQKRNKEQAQP